MDVAIKINDQAFQLGEELETDKLANADCQKGGVWVRNQVAVTRDEVVYYTKNCFVHFFDLDFLIFPSERKYLDSDMNWGTSAYLVFAENRLDRLVFQVNKSRNAAARYAEEFSWACNTRFGDPRSAGTNDNTWIGHEVTVACQTDGSSKTSQFYWMKN